MRLMSVTCPTFHRLRSTFVIFLLRVLSNNLFMSVTILVSLWWKVRSKSLTGQVFHNEAVRRLGSVLQRLGLPELDVPILFHGSFSVFEPQVHRLANRLVVELSLELLNRKEGRGQSMDVYSNWVARPPFK